MPSTRTLWVRTDSSTEIGTGHIGRCTALAIRLRERGWQVEFFCRRLPGSSGRAIEENGFTLHWLPAPQAPLHPWTGVPLDQEIAECAEKLRRRAPEAPPVRGWIVDHYGLDSRWEEGVRTGAHQPWVMAIDDYTTRPHTAELLLNQNFMRNPPESLGPSRLLFGPKYALLREEFRQLRAQRKTGQSNAVPTVLVFFGGVDLPNLSALAIKALAPLRGVQVQVVVGSANPHTQELLLLVEKLSAPHIELLLNEPAFAKRVASSDLVIGAGGMTTWERCCLGVASAVVCIAENQELSSHELGASGYHLYLGRHTELTVESFRSRIENLLAEKGAREAMALRTMDLVDGLGTDRVADEIEILDTQYGSSGKKLS